MHLREEAMTQLQALLSEAFPSTFEGMGWSVQCFPEKMKKTMPEMLV
jgi:hypothetical protein